MTAAQFARLVERARPRADGVWWDACCPGHDDQRASLSFCDGDRGLVLECHTGCAFETIAQKLGRSPSDFFRTNDGASISEFRPTSASRIVATYPYVDETGRGLYEVVRREPKDFRCRRTDTGGALVWNLDGVRVVPYRLNTLAAAARVYIAEGEKDCDTLVARGLTATTNHGGAGKWRDIHTRALVEVAAAAEVIVLRDNDQPGAAHQEAVARACAAAGLRVKCLALPGLSPLRVKHGEDVTDWLSAGHTPAELESLAAAAPVFTLEGEPTPTPEAATIPAASITEILAADPVTLQTRYIVSPHIPVGVNILSARPGVGKGKLAQDLCLARATGGTWLGLSVEPGPALFWSGEQGRREDFRVTQALCRGRGIAAADFRHHFEVVYDPALRFGHPTMLAYVMRRLTEHPGLFIAIDSHRRAFEGDESDSAAADAYFRETLSPLRAAGATTFTLAHPPKTTGQQKTIPDESMIRGSGDWLAQVDGFLVLRPVSQVRPAADRQTLVMRLVHPKARSGPQAPPMLITLDVTADLTPQVAFRLSGGATGPDADVADAHGALQAAAALVERHGRIGRTPFLKALDAEGYGRKAGEAALTALLDRGVLRGPLDAAERRVGERGHWYVFARPLDQDPVPALPEWVTDPEADLDA